MGERIKEIKKRFFTLALFFTIVDNVLSRLQLRPKKMWYFRGLCGGLDRIKVTHLQLVGDAIFFFSRAKAEDLQYLKLILQIFCHIQGLNINLDRSILLGINFTHGLL